MVVRIEIGIARDSAVQVIGDADRYDACAIEAVMAGIDASKSDVEGTAVMVGTIRSKCRVQNSTSGCRVQKKRAVRRSGTIGWTQGDLK